MDRPLLTVVETPAYLTKAAKLLISDEERAAIVSLIAADPAVGDLIKGTGGLRKVRIGFGGRGKRGGGRVIYFFHSERYPAALLWVFAKNEASDLTADQRAILAREAEALVRDLGGRQ